MDDGSEVHSSVVMTASDAAPPLHPNTDAVCRMLGSDADWAMAVDLYVVGQPACELGEPRRFAQRLPIIPSHRAISWLVKTIVTRLKFKYLHV